MNIWRILLTPVYFLLDLLISVLPAADSGTVDFLNSAVSNMQVFFVNANNFFPVQLFFTFVSIIITVESVLLGWKVLRFILTHITFGLTK